MEADLLTKLPTLLPNSQSSLKLSYEPENSKFKSILLNCYKVLKPDGTLEIAFETQQEKLESLLKMTGFVEIAKTADGKALVGKKVAFEAPCESSEEAKEDLALRIKEALKIDRPQGPPKNGACANCTCGRSKYD